MANQLLDVFARSIFAKKALFGPELTDRQRRRLRKSIVEDIRACGAFIFPGVKKPEVSEAAHRKASLKGIDLCEMYGIAGLKSRLRTALQSICGVFALSAWHCNG